MAEAGVESVAFVTLTLGDRDQWGDWVKVYDAAEASRRINNLARRVLPSLFEYWAIVTERHKDGGIHFHLLAVVKGRADIRAGYDFEAASDGDYSSASDALRAIWRRLREEDVERMGFGRCETEPVRSTGEAVACYVSKYIEKNICNRLAADKGKKLVRYGQWPKDGDGNSTHLKPNGFNWATPRAIEWRNKARAICATKGLGRPQDVREEIGPRWAFRINQLMHDAGLGDWRKPDEPRWEAGWDMTRDQSEMCRDWLERAAKKRDATGASRKSAEELRAIWERALTPQEIEALQADLKWARECQLMRGLDFGDVEEWKNPPMIFGTKNSQ